jgi:pyruvate dehydrogenase E2 component (dihydrolipoamide acetyltransferase)
MAIEVTMPRLSDTMQEGTLVKWHVKIGDAVKAGQVLADVETDKATMELQSFDDGVVATLDAAEGQVAQVGKRVLVLATGGESAEEAVKAIAAAPGAAAVASASTETAENTGGPHPDPLSGGEGAEQAPGRVRISPLASKLAEDLGVEVSRLRGSGPDGRIIKRDVLAAHEAAPAALGAGTAGGSGPHPNPLPRGEGVGTQTGPATEVGQAAVARSAGQAQRVALSSMRKTIARRLVESKTTIPHFTVTVAVDMDLLLGPRGAKSQLETQGIKLSVNDFVIRAVALALPRHPYVNASWVAEGEGAIELHEQVNIGVAVALPAEKGGGLVVPVLHQAQAMGLRAISAAARAAAEKARTRGLTVEEMSGATFTLSNLGMFGVEHFEAIINPPQAAILAVGAAMEKAVVRKGAIVPGLEMTLTLSSDHRVVDGAMAAQFLQTVKQMLENPAVLLV